MCGISDKNNEYNKSHETDCDESENHETHPTFLCNLFVLLLLFINFDLRL